MSLPIREAIVGAKQRSNVFLKMCTLPKEKEITAFSQLLLEKPVIDMN